MTLSDKDKIFNRKTSMPSAIIDLGTNTFHLIIFEKNHILTKKSLAARLGMGGINNGIITREGIERGVGVLKIFREELDNFQVRNENVFAFGTSALRSAKNKEEVLKTFNEKTDIEVNVIGGEEEAALIYEGVKLAVDIRESSLIVDIGGGSVEFIICNAEKVLWKQSFEIGGQRLLEKFMKKDPIPMAEVGRLEEYLRQCLLPLSNAVHQYQPCVLIGSSGTFDTLNDLYYQKTQNQFPPEETVGFAYPIEEFYWAYEQLVFNNRAERMTIPGMRELRVDMIVVAMVLVRFLLQNFGIKEIKISNYALKEGAMKHVGSSLFRR